MGMTGNGSFSFSNLADSVRCARVPLGGATPLHVLF